MAKLLVIVGITGNQGSSVYDVFKNETGWRIRGITRDPAKANCGALLDAGVDLVKADLDDEISFEHAFEGANAIHAVTDFFQHLFNDPSSFARARAEGKKPVEIAMEREVEQGQNIIRAAAKASDQRLLMLLTRTPYADLLTASGHSGKAGILDAIRRAQMERRRDRKCLSLQ